jgi:2,3-bisphosphoglycerate-dependent phosphoglycerate mutase
LATLNIVSELILLRHGQSQWNELNLFTGWHDVDLTPLGEREASAAGTLLVDAEVNVLHLHTSRLTRAIRTAELALYAAGRSWVDVSRTWRLNERHYGDLTGKDKKETAEKFGMDQLKLWRRSFDVPPPPLPDGDPRRNDADPRYRDVPEGLVPATECLADVVVRVRPYLDTQLLPDLARCAEAGGALLVVAHGNSLRALRMILEDISPDDITELEIPTGIPYRYTLNGATVQSGSYLGDAEAAASAAAAVAAQAG